MIDGSKRYLVPEVKSYDSTPFEEYTKKYLNEHTKILFVDDDQKICDLIKDAFSSITKHIHFSNSFEQAVRYLGRNSVDILITDINLPGKDGFELVKWINKRKKLSGIPIVLITGVMRDKDSVIKSRKIGVDKFIAKPFELSRLITDVDLILDPNYKKKKHVTVHE